MPQFHHIAYACNEPYAQYVAVKWVWGKVLPKRQNSNTGLSERFSIKPKDLLEAYETRIDFYQRARIS